MPLATGRFGRNTHWHVTPVSISITSPEGSNPALVPSNSEGPTVQTHLVAAVLVRHAHTRAERRLCSWSPSPRAQPLPALRACRLDVIPQTFDVGGARFVSGED